MKLKKAVLMTAALAMLTVPFTGIKASSGTDSIEEKIKQYKEFKKNYEDKDFELKDIPIKRTEWVNGKIKSTTRYEYHISYGMLKDNIKDYLGLHRHYTPAKYAKEKNTPSESGWVLEDTMNYKLKTKALEDAKLSYSVSLIFETLSKEELDGIFRIYEFPDGDVDIRLDNEEMKDKDFAERITKKLQEADEKNDQKRPETKMEPIIPLARQMILMPLILDEDKNGEKDSIILPYCLDGSYSDRNPYNNSLQVFLKYKLTTKKDLEGKTGMERQRLEERLGLWKWDKPSEVYIDFIEEKDKESGNKKLQNVPDIVFYDYGKVVDGKVVDEKPDGKFDEYKFLY